MRERETGNPSFTPQTMEKLRLQKKKYTKDENIDTEGYRMPRKDHPRKESPELVSIKVFGDISTHLTDKRRI